MLPAKLETQTLIDQSGIWWHDTYPAYDNLSDLAHSSIWTCGFGELFQEVLMQRDVSIQVAKDVGELLLGHNGELQHRVMVRLCTGAEPKRSNNKYPIRPGEGGC